MFRVMVGYLAAVIVLMSGSDAFAFTKKRLFPLTRCGHDLRSLCRLHGSFDQPPFHYNVAISPRCIKSAKVGPRQNQQRQLVIICE